MTIKLCEFGSLEKELVGIGRACCPLYHIAQVEPVSDRRQVQGDDAIKKGAGALQVCPRVISRASLLISHPNFLGLKVACDTL